MEQTAYLEKSRYKQPGQKQKNADNFASNNNNPFLVSPYSPVNLGAFATNNFVNEVSTIVSTLFGNLASVLDVATYTLSINTIQPMPITNNPSQTIVMNMSSINMNSFFNINMTTPTVNMSNDLHVANNLVAQNLYFSTATGSTISTFTSNTSGQLTATNMSFVKMTGDTITTSTINVSTISSTQLFINVPNMISISTPTVNMSQDLFVSHNLIAQNLYFSTATGSTISTFTSNTSGQLTATNMGFLTMSGNTINTSTINLSSINCNNTSITLSAPNAFVISTPSVTMSNNLLVSNNLNAQNIFFSTSAGAQLSASNIGFVSIAGNDAIMNYTTTTSSLNANLISSGMISSGMITFSNMIGNTVTVNSTLSVSTLNGNNFYLSLVSISSLSASTTINNSASISSLSASSMTNTSASISSLSASSMTNTSASISSLSASSITNIAASVSILNATTLNNTTLNGSNIICSTVNAATYLSSNSATFTNAAVTTLGNTTLNGISINGNTIVCSTVTAATTLTSNGTTSAGNLNFTTITWPSGTIGTTPTLTAGNSYVTIKIGATTYKLALYQ